jgi:prepilin-type N-terminal cleavage/methylation domain-containing protein
VARLAQTISSAKGSGHSRRRFAVAAFTLVELVMVLVILACLAGIATPRYAASLNNYGASTAARRIVADLAYAQSLARTTGVTKTVSFDKTNNQYQIVGLTDPDKPSQTYTVSISAAPYRGSIAAVSLLNGATAVTQVNFDKYGFPDAGGTITVQVGTVQMTATLNTTSGKATVP